MLPTHEAKRSIHSVRHQLADLDYQEVINFSFVEESTERDFAAGRDPIRLLNPIASQMSVMRSTLLSGLVGNIAYNVKRKVPRLRVFEIAKVYLREPAAPDEPLAIADYRQPLRVAGAAFGAAVDEQWAVKPTRPVDFYDVKRDVESLAGAAHWRYVAAPHPAFHPGRSARIEHDGQSVGWLGELHPRLARVYELPTSPVLFELDWAALQHIGLPAVGPVSKFPPVRRDLNIVVDEQVPAQALVDAMVRAKPDAVAEIQLFDVYRGASLPKGKKSLAFLVLMQDTQRTLTDTEIDAAMEQLFTTLRTGFNGTTR
jgi:phenylalanyl-tRNA synthetase beta chain